MPVPAGPANEISLCLSYTLDLSFIKVQRYY